MDQYLTPMPCADIGQKCLQLLGMHALSGCDTTPYLCGKGKVTALNTMASENYQGKATISDVGTTITESIHAAMPSIVALYSQPPGASMEFTCYTIFTKRGEILKRWLHLQHL